MSEAKHYLTGTTFTCTGDDATPCHVYPSCECETWYEDHGELGPDHQPAAHPECWMIAWLNATSPDDTAWPYLLLSEIHDGEIAPEWNGDEVIWSYAQSAEQPIEDDDADKSLDDCAACDAPLTKCRPDAGCCDDCTHAANWPPSNRTAEGSFSGCAVYGAVAVEDAGDHADQTGHWPPANQTIEGAS